MSDGEEWNVGMFLSHELNVMEDIGDVLVD